MTNKNIDALQGVIQSKIPAVEATTFSLSPWLAASLLQKAIRRGEKELALNAAASLLTTDPARFWRRLGIIAFEDIGLADLQIPSLVATALAGKTYRSKFGSEWSVASSLVSKMADTPKCRAADDLLMVVERHPFLAEERTKFVTLSTPALIDIATGQGDIRTCALALWYAIGTTNVRSDYLGRRTGDPGAVLDAFSGLAGLGAVAQVAGQGFRRTKQILCPFLMLLAPALQSELTTVRDDPLPAERRIGQVPCWAFDMFVREGRRTLWTFLDRECASTRWMKDRIPRPRRIEFLGNVLFAVEGGLLRSRCDRPTAARLRHWAEIESQGPGCPDATEIIELIRADLPLLNEVRAHVR